MSEFQFLSRSNRPRIEMDRSELGDLVVRSYPYGVNYRPSFVQRLWRWLRLTKPCQLHGRDRWCTNCDPAPYRDDE